MHSTSASLLARLRQPDASADWERFVQLYTPLLFHWGRRAGLDQDEAEDLVQDIFSILLAKLPEFSYDGQRSFRSWLRTVTLNHWRNVIRRKRREPRGAPTALLEDIPADSDSLFDQEEYRKELLHQAMEQLQSEFAPRTWTAFVEHGLNARPARQVAEMLGTSEGAVHAAKFRVLSRLKSYLHGLLD